MLSALLLLVFAAGLRRRLMEVLPAGSLLPQVAASGLLLVSVTLVMGTALTTEFVFGVDDSDGSRCPRTRCRRSTVRRCREMADLDQPDARRPHRGLRRQSVAVHGGVTGTIGVRPDGGAAWLGRGICAPFGPRRLSDMTPSTMLPPPRWAVIAAHATLLITLPSGIWRIFVGFGFNMGFSDEFWGPHFPGWGTLYVFLLIALTEFVVFLTIGLVRPWGERVPAWIPLLGGRSVWPWAAIVPATLGGLFLVVFGAQLPFAFFGEVSPEDQADGWWAVLMAVCYLPLVAWGPLVLAVTYAYYRRRCRPGGSVALEHRPSGLEPSHRNPERGARDVVQADSVEEVH